VVYVCRSADVLQLAAGMETLLWIGTTRRAWSTVARVCVCMCSRPSTYIELHAQVEQGQDHYDYGLFKRFLYATPHGTEERMITAGWATSLDVCQEGRTVPWPSVCLGLSAECRKEAHLV
jgi:hypothetical protein